MSEDERKNLNNCEISDLNRYNFLPSYSFMELIAYINARYCSVHSIYLIMSENMRFRPYSYQCFLGTLIFDGWSD